jgi:hypothetical protein
MRLMSTALSSRSHTSNNTIIDEDSSRATLLLESRGKEKWGWLQRLGQWYRLTVPLPLTTNKLNSPKTLDRTLDSRELEGTVESTEFPSTEQAMSSHNSTQQGETQPGAQKIGASTEITNTVMSGSTSLTASHLAWPLGFNACSAFGAFSQDKLKKSWTGPIVTTSATFGHLLHHHATLNTTSTRDVESQFDTGALYPTLLSPIIPPLSSLSTLPLVSNYSIEPSTSIICRFRPHPSHDNPIAKYGPELELHLTPAADKQSDSLSWENTKKRLIAIFSSNDLNVMIPNAPVDFQVTQRLSFEMNPETLEKSSALKRFIETSIFDLAEGTLLTPPTIELPIPRALCTDQYFMDRNDVTKSNSTDHLRNDGEPQTERTFENTNLRILYMFTGLELHQTGIEPYLGHCLRYSSIEAGHHGGRRGEISLDFDPHRASSEEEQSGLSKAFLDTAFDIATGKYFSWIGANQPSHN